MKHPLEIENEELQKRLEATYNEILDVDCKISNYAIMEMADTISKNNILTNNTTFKDIINWGNTK